jgi:tripeptide aminopeptidase
LNEEKLIEQTRHMTYSMEAAAKKYGGSVDIIVERAYGAFRISDESPVVKAVEKAFHNLEITTELVGSGGGSDTNNFNSNGIEAVNIAIGERNAHTLEEHIFIEDIKTSAKLVLELIKLHS